MSAVKGQVIPDRGTPPGTPSRIALPLAGDDPKAMQVVMEFINDTGFDTGGLDESWRQQPGIPVYTDTKRVKAG